MEYLLYKLAPKTEHTEDGSQPKIQGECATFSPFDVRWFVPMLRAGGVESVKAVVLAAWSVVAGLASRGEIKVWAFVGGNGKILHYSVVTPTAMHLPWLSPDKVGYEIGGCFTVPGARGLRLFPHILRQIDLWASYERPIYMIVEAGNSASRAGMERAGFDIAGSVQRGTRLGRPPVYQYQNDKLITKG